jgi:glycosyltransferase involved in cell wall biosynthesis
VAQTLAEALGADLVLQFTSVEDIHRVKPAWVEQAGHCIASSQPLYDEVAALPGTKPDHVSLVRPGVLAGAAPTCFAKPGRLPSVLCTQPFRPGCGVDHLLQAVRLLRDRKWEFLLFLTGSGPMEAQLRKQARQLGLSSTVVFARPMGDTASLMIGADFYVEPTADHALSAAPLHAMANGMAVVAVEGGVADHFVDGVNAVVCADDSPTELAGAVEKLLADRQGAVELARAAIAHMKKHHPISAMVEQTLAVYQSLVLRAKTLPLETA